MERHYEENVKLGDIKNFLFQRSTFDQEKFDELVASAKEGIIEPILVRKHDSGYQGIAGYMRYIASREAKNETIPAIVYDQLSDHDAYTMCAVENFQRQDMNDLDTAVLLSFLVSSKERKEVARELGKSEAFISQYLRLLEDTKPIKSAVQEGKITEAQARHIRRLPDSIHTKAVREVKGKTVEQTAKVVTEMSKNEVKAKVEGELKEAREKLTEIGKAENELNNIKAEISEVKASLKTLKTDDKQVNKKLMKLSRVENEYFPVVREISDLQSQIAINKKALRDTDVKELESERDSLNLKLQKTRKTIEELNQAIKARREERNTIEEKLNELKRKLNDVVVLNKRIGESESKLRSYKDEIAELKKELGKEIGDFDTLKAQVGEDAQKVLSQRKTLMIKIEGLITEERRRVGLINQRKNVEAKIAEKAKELKRLGAKTPT